jgi:hypothetical protein
MSKYIHLDFDGDNLAVTTEGISQHEAIGALIMVVEDLKIQWRKTRITSMEGLK